MIKFPGTCNNGVIVAVLSFLRRIFEKFDLRRLQDMA